MNAARLAQYRIARRQHVLKLAGLAVVFAALFLLAGVSQTLRLQALAAIWGW